MSSVQEKKKGPEAAYIDQATWYPFNSFKKIFDGRTFQKQIGYNSEMSHEVRQRDSDLRLNKMLK